MNNAFKTIRQGAATSIWVATSPDLNGVGGAYCEDCHVAEKVAADSDVPFEVRPWATDPVLAKCLWNISEALTGVTFSI